MYLSVPQNCKCVDCYLVIFFNKIVQCKSNMWAMLVNRICSLYQCLPYEYKSCI